MAEMKKALANRMLIILCQLMLAFEEMCNEEMKCENAMANSRNG